MYYPDAIQETGAISKYMGWGRNEIMSMSVRERRFWVSWATEVSEKEQKVREETWARLR